jgi:uncharacterized protein (DUF302 family)
MQRFPIRSLGLVLAAAALTVSAQQPMPMMVPMQMPMQMQAPMPMMIPVQTPMYPMPMQAPTPQTAAPQLIPVPMPFPVPTNITPADLPFPLNLTVLPFQGYGAPTGGGAIRDYQMSRMIPRKDKIALLRNATPLLSMLGFGDIRSVMNFMAVKYPAKDGMAFDDVVESMKLRANTLNFKLVGHSPMWKDFQAVLGDTTAPKVEVFHYCDIAVGRELLKLAPESAIYLPCRIVVMEDADKKVWVMGLDWDMAWLDTAQGSMGVSPTLAKHAVDIRDKMDNIMQAAANGEL